jgi:hypothetical protein
VTRVAGFAIEHAISMDCTNRPIASNVAGDHFLAIDTEMPATYCTWNDLFDDAILTKAMVAFFVSHFRIVAHASIARGTLSFLPGHTFIAIITFILLVAYIATYRAILTRVCACTKCTHSFVGP